MIWSAGHNSCGDGLTTTNHVSISTIERDDGALGNGQFEQGSSLQLMTARAHRVHRGSLPPDQLGRGYQHDVVEREPRCDVVHCPPGQGSVRPRCMTGLSPSQIEEAARLYEGGWSLAQVGMHMEVSSAADITAAGRLRGVRARGPLLFAVRLPERYDVAVRRGCGSWFTVVESWFLSSLPTPVADGIGNHGVPGCLTVIPKSRLGLVLTTHFAHQTDRPRAAFPVRIWPIRDIY